MTITLKNVSLTTQRINDLGIELEPSAEISLLDVFTKEELIGSQDLETAIGSSDFELKIDSTVSGFTALIEKLSYAQSITYDGTNSGLDATTVQQAIDEIVSMPGMAFPSFLINRNAGLIFSKQSGFIFYKKRS